MTKKVYRRDFNKAAAAFGLAALQTETSQAKIIGANDTIRCAFAGVANRGRQVIDAFLKNDKMEIAGLADVDANTLNASAERFAPKALREKDFRKFLDNKDIDAIVIATPDHWHAFQTIESCKAGKDVYVEKPLATTVKEGRMMVQAARKYNRVVQCGIHRRSAPLYRRVVDENIIGKIGQVTVASTGHVSNMYPNGIGKAQTTTPPPYLDWDLWLGPRQQKYQENIAPYKFRWWISYCSQIANQGVHFIDLFRWFLKEKAPVSVCAMGGKFAVDDDRTIPDTLHVCFQFASGKLLNFSHYEANGNPIMATDANYRPLGYIEFRGTQGTLYINDRHCLIKSEKPGQFQAKGPRAAEEEFLPEDGKQGNVNETALHAGNFLDCIRSRQKPNTDVEEGHLSTILPHLANISLALDRKLHWDAENERFTDCEEANNMLFCQYRAPWKLEL